MNAQAIEQVLDQARTLAEKDAYDFPYGLFNTQDMAYIEKAIEALASETKTLKGAE